MGHVKNLLVKLVYEGHRNKVKVTGAERSNERNYKQTHSRAVHLRLKDNLVCIVFDDISKLVF